MKHKITMFGYILLLVCVLGMFSGCGDREESPTGRTFVSRGSLASQKKTDAPKQQEKQELYMIQELNMLEETITLTSLTDGKQERYGYSLTTRFLDKYGDSSSSMNFTPGNVVSLGELLPSAKLSSVQMSDQVWKQTDVKRYSIDAQKGMLTLGSTKYRLTPETAVFSNLTKVSLEDVGSEDVLEIIGQDKKVISIAVTTGHGYIRLVHTDLFQGSMICIGDRIFTKISGDMTLPVPEGAYDITVANDGYGGTANYTVKRNETTEVDLDTLKGEGPKICKLSFDVSVKEASIYLDGEKVDADKELSVKYGNHTLQVTAEGYDTWSRTLVVNSPSAQIVLDLEDEKQSDASSGTNDNSTSGSSNTNSSSTNSSNTNSSNTNNNNTNNNNTKNNTAAANNTSSNNQSSSNGSNNKGGLDVDYLTTLNELISTLILTK